MKNAAWIFVFAPCVALCQINPYIPLGVRPMQLDNPVNTYQQLQNIRAARAIADESEARQAREQQARQADSVAQGRRADADKSLGDAWKAAASKRAYLYPDFVAVVFAKDVTISTDMIRLMSVSDYAADIAYYFGTHKIESVAVANMPILDAAKTIASIEQQFKDK